MTIQHSVITDPDLHEPKGVAAAAADTVYVADGAGSGTWQKVDSDGVDGTYTQAVKDAVETEINDGTISIPRAETYIYAIIPDISTASTLFIPIPEDSEVLQMTMVLEGAITVANANIALKTSADAAILSQAVAFSGSAAGDTYTATSPTNASITGPSYLKLSTDGGSTDAQRLFVTIQLYVTRTL